MTAKDAYQYFVIKGQELALSKNWIPVNWYDIYIYLEIPHQKVFHSLLMSLKAMSPWSLMLVHVSLSV